MARLNEERLPAYLDGDLPEGEMADITRALENDASLKQELDTLKAARRGLRRAFEMPPSPAFADRVVRRIASNSRPSGWIKPLAIAASVAVVAMGAWMAAPLTDDREAYAVRGSSEEAGGESRLGVEVYLHPKSNPLDKRIATDGMTMQGSDGFSFLLFNRSGKETHFMLFGLDARGEVYWLYPEGGSTETARSLVISASPTMRPLPEGVTPGPVPAGPFRIIALFTGRPAVVDDVAAAVHDAGTAGLAARYGDAVVQVLTLQVTDEAGR